MHVNKILVGNKCDMLDEKVVSTEEGAKLAKEFGVDFYECSAKNDINVEQSFLGIARAVKDRLIADGGGAPGESACYTVLYFPLVGFLCWSGLNLELLLYSQFGDET